MLKKVKIAFNSLEPEVYEEFETENVIELLKSKFNLFPDTARIYHKQVSLDNDVTPTNEKEAEHKLSGDGPFYIIVYPGEPTTILLVALGVALAGAVAMMFLMQPPTVAQRNTQTSSSNNELSNRVNKARPNGRIPDIYGTVRSTPDLIGEPYKIFSNNVEYEICNLCIGRGSYNISDVRDDTTLVSNIDGESIEFYGPNTSPNSGSPFLTIGDSINEPLINTEKYDSINGQTLEPSNGYRIRGKNDIYFEYPNKIWLTGASGKNFTDVFDTSLNLVISNATFDVTVLGVTITYDLAGTYPMSTIAATCIELDNPSSINSDWNHLDDLTDNKTGNLSPLLVESGDHWIGPYILTDPSLNEVICNFVAQSGLYKDDGTNQTRFNVTCELELTPLNDDDTARGSAELFQTTVNGSAKTRDSRGSTLRAVPTFTGRCKARARRVTLADLTFTGTVVDEIKWCDLYSVSPVTETNFGNVTTAQAKTLATRGALAIKERKSNMLVTRKLPARIGTTSTFTTELYATNNVADIICAICLDPYIGARNIAEIDVLGIYNTVAEATTYFGTSKAMEFNYTFDKDNLSFEETVKTIADTVFCNAYRQGNIIKLSFEKRTNDSVLLFNHRNKIPRSETRTVRFGNLDNFDGVSYSYIDPKDDSMATYYIPEDRSAVNPKEIESIGVRSKLQARLHAYRIWNKIRYQNIGTEFEATQEADLLVLNDRILVADNTRSETQDGEVLNQDGLLLTLSQDVVYEDGVSYTIFLQHINKTVESIPIMAGPQSKQVILSRAPISALALDENLSARTIYWIVGNDDVREQAFLVSEKKPQSNFTSTVLAINYSDEYYLRDSDYVNRIVDINGNII